MQESILPKLESSRKELLDLGMRNTLLNYKVPKARGLSIVQEKSSSIFSILVKQQKAMTFLGRPGKDDDSEVLESLPELTEPELLDAYNDTRLQTNEKEHRLQTKILNTYYFAKTSIEEQGVNLLYITLGMLKWYESGNTEQPRFAPLILIPVSLERSSASERFRLRYSGAEIGANLSLQAKMMVDFNITIPDLIEDELNIEAYIADIKSRIEHHPEWVVDLDTIELGFFSFGKFMIYHDLDSNRWPVNQKPCDNQILQALFGNGFKESEPTASENHNLDKHTIAHQLFQVVDADSSQVLAMLAVHEGRNMVIQGPPGTGKSQTITNIIANAVGYGKKVLFVAEKMAALEVVKRRLDSVQLGEACLELHSHKSNKRTLHEELRRVLDLGKPTFAHLNEEIQFLEPIIKELNDYCDEVNKQIGESGYSTHEIIGNLLQIKREHNDYPFPKIAVDKVANWDLIKFREGEQVAELIQTRINKIGEPSKLAFSGIGINVFLPSDEETIKVLLTNAIEATTALKKTSKDIAGYMDISFLDDLESINRQLVLVEQAEKQPILGGGLSVKSDLWLNNKNDIEDLIETGEKLNAIHQEFDSYLLPEAYDQSVLEIRQNLIAHGNKWYKFLIGDYSKSLKQLSSFLKGPMPADLNTKIKYVDAILESRRLTATFQSVEHIGSELFGSHWQKLRSRWKSLEAIAVYMQAVHTSIQKDELPISFLPFLERNEPKESSYRNTLLLKEALKVYHQAISSLVIKLKYTEQVLQKSLSWQDELYKKWLNNLPEINDSVNWNVLRESVIEKGFSDLLNAVDGWSDVHLYLKIALQKTWYEQLIEHAMLNSSTLRKFERSNHEETISKFRKLDILNQQYNRVKVALKHWEGVPKQDGGGQINILKNEFNRKSRHMPIRKLMENAGLAIQAIKPVIMMSPMSIANFLPPDSVEFDLVVFDEASQVRPVDALGAVLRGKQLIVVGDTKQMPPTSFFDKLNTETEDEENVTADMQSILGMCDGQGAPQRMLRWHYRSRHESLISLSNQEFYENKLIIFPSPGSKYRMGLSFHYLPDTIYDKGKTRTNPKEAEKVVDAVVEHAIQFPKLSLGVVAFSSSQMQAIQNALEIRRRINPELESFFRSHPEEPFFIKNLENVQGDERDVIFISIGYGRVAEGNVPQSFGPLNNEGGERRLNVLITRAKRRCEVFTNINANDITPGPNTKFGVKSLKRFLYFAEHGKFDRDELIAEVKNPPFEDLVAKTLVNAGYIVRKKVGSAGFAVDLAVVDPENPGRYLVGITCDGSSYNTAKSARDRDRLRKEVLEGMQWRIAQVWSIDWFRNPKKELRYLVEYIEKIKIQTGIDDALEEDAYEENQQILREQQNDFSILIPAYAIAQLPNEVRQMELHLQSFGKLGTWIKDVVKVESPVHIDEVARRIADANGVSKIGSRIRYTISAATEYAESSGLVNRKGDFLWSNDMVVPYIRERSNLSSNSRKLEYIAPEELDIAIKKVVDESIAIKMDGAIPLIAKLFGFARVTEEMKKFITGAIEKSVLQGTIQQDALFLKAISI